MAATEKSSEKPIVRNNIETILNGILVNTYWKDKKGNYLGCNQSQLDALAAHSDDEIIGKKDRHLIWRKQAPILEKNDREVIYTGRAKTVIETVACYQDRKVEHFLSHKVPLFSSKGKIIGTFGLSFLANGKQSIFLSLRAVRLLNLTGITDITDSGQYTVTNDILRSKLSKRQLDCLRCLVEGMTMKETAKSLQLSPKTVEHYLDAVKMKLNCSTRTELIKKALLII